MIELSVISGYLHKKFFSRYMLWGGGWGDFCFCLLSMLKMINGLKGRRTWIFFHIMIQLRMFIIEGFSSEKGQLIIYIMYVRKRTCTSPYVYCLHIDLNVVEISHKLWFYEYFYGHMGHIWYIVHSRIRKEISPNQQQQTRNEVRVDDGTKYKNKKKKRSAVHFTPWQILHFLHLLSYF